MAGVFEGLGVSASRRSRLVGFVKEFLGDDKVRMVADLPAEIMKMVKEADCASVWTPRDASCTCLR